ncbi:MAG TPA: AI-2E family transporter [Gammaproteobacteria bacterium]|nr:AI-2E family transporter [Gammaproteobacteria bacterium]
MRLFKEWFRRYLSNPQVVILLTFLTLGFVIVLFTGDILAPVLASMVIAYLLQSIVTKLQRIGMSQLPAVLTAFMLFLAVLLLLLFYVTPELSQQVSQLVPQLPEMIEKGLVQLQALLQKNQYISEQQILEIINNIKSEISSYGQSLLIYISSSIPDIITLVVYLILMPMLVFFFLKDRDLMIDWASGFMPKDTELSSEVWRDVDLQIGNYVRGKMLEIMVVWIACYIAFAVMGLNYAFLLAAAVGLSVIIPYIGAVVVTIPVALVAYFQWGWSADFAYLLISYLVIQGIDGTVIVPLLFSEVVNLHPIAIIVAVLFFGGLWGFWGVFFAIPLATAVQAIIKAWPKENAELSGEL